MGFTTAAIVAEQRAELIKVTTGCKELDDILEGKLKHGLSVSSYATRPFQACIIIQQLRSTRIGLLQAYYICWLPAT